MGWGNPPVPWSEVERVLSGRPAPGHAGDGNDSPAWSRIRQPYVPPVQRVSRTVGAVPYAELHAHSNFSFLDGASHPEELAEEAARLGLESLALTDHDGMYGVVRFTEAARELGLPTIFGAELSLGLRRRQNGAADPEGTHLLVLARDVAGYRALSRVISLAQLAGEEKGRPVYDLEELAAQAEGRWLILTGCRKGAVRQGLTAGVDAAAAALDRLTAMFGRDNVAVELVAHGYPDDDEINQTLVALAESAGKGLPVLATNNVHYAAPGRARLAGALAAVRARRSLDEMDGWLPPTGGAHLRSGVEMAAIFARYPGAVRTAAALGRECAFDLHLVAPRLPPYPVPPGHTEASWLRQLVKERAPKRYGPPEAERIAGAYAQVNRELDLIESLTFPGYFLIVWDIVEFCLRESILCQGRGSAANSAVCFVLGITPIDPVKHELLFERFLSVERDGPPDIDLDIESGRREEVIQYVYERYGRHRAAQVANVVTYRPKSAVRDMAKALGHPLGQQDAWSRQLGHWASLASTDHEIPTPVVDLARQVEGFPRHLGIHSGGMVLCERPVIDVCPVEWANMPGRTVLQWDKDDCAAMGLVKFDLLGLGMLSALHNAMDFIRDHHGVDVEIATMPQEKAVYDMLCEADSIGVFQVESRAQMATLPRLKPQKFYDLVVEVALIRPGPIQGGSVHPYLRRRDGVEKVSYPHPRLEKTLKRTLGVPLFQEQLMQMAVAIADFTPSEADKLRRAIGSKRSQAKMVELRERLYNGMATHGITGREADSLYEKLLAFASYGFPESHSISFAMLVYASSWIKLHYPAAFCAALLNAQPMGFYSPQSLVGDARRHGVEIRPVDINASGALATLEPIVPAQQLSPVALRIGLSSVRTIGKELAELIETERTTDGSYADIADLTRRVRLTSAQAEALATAGAFTSFGQHRRESLWAAGSLAHNSPDKLPATTTGSRAPELPEMTDVEHTVADLWATGITPDGYPTQHLRDKLDALGVLTSVGLRAVPADSRVLVGGVVTHRQRPATASGTTFMTLEDETGLVNIICSPGAWTRFRKAAQQAPALLIRGRLESAGGVRNVVAEAIHEMPMIGRGAKSRDFR